MAWVRIDDGFPQHPKVAGAGPLGLAMQVAALCYCNRYLTDGFIPRAVVPTLLDFSGLGMRQWSGELVGGGEDAGWRLVVEDLEASGLWVSVKGGWQIHDYLEYQEPREEILAKRQRVAQVRAGAGKKGATARWNPNGVSAGQDGKNGKRDGKPLATEKQTDSPTPLPTEVLSEPLKPLAPPSAVASKKPAAPKPNLRTDDPLWDAVCFACGIDQQGLTSKARLSVNTAVKELRDINAQPSDVAPRARRLAERWGPDKLTPHSLAKHWPQLNGAHNGQPTITCSICNAYTHIDSQCIVGDS